MEYKEKFLEAEEKYEILNAKLENLSAYVHRTQSFSPTDAQNATAAFLNQQVIVENIPQDSSEYVPVTFPNVQVNDLNPVNIKVTKL